MESIPIILQEILTVTVGGGGGELNCWGWGEGVELKPGLIIGLLEVHSESLFHKFKIKMGQKKKKRPNIGDQKKLPKSCLRI